MSVCLPHGFDFPHMCGRIDLTTKRGQMLNEILERIPTQDFDDWMVKRGKYTICMWEDDNSDFEIVQEYSFNDYLTTLIALGFSVSAVGEIFWRLWKDESFDLIDYNYTQYRKDYIHYSTEMVP